MTNRFADCQTVEEVVFQTVGAASTLWMTRSDRVFDDVQAREVAQEAIDRLDQLNWESQEPLLGLATTGELLDELRARVEVHGLLGYRTVGEFGPADRYVLTPDRDEPAVC